ncbi:hypothetical protein TrRE_jg6615, partial [Triparma retinervis]
MEKTMEKTMVIFSLKSKSRHSGETQIEVLLNCTMPPNYPFNPPLITLTAPPSSLSDYTPNTPVHLSLHWTPSLTLTSAVVDVGVRVKEALLSGEPITQSEHSTSPPPNPTTPSTPPPPPVDVSKLRVGDTVLASLIPSDYTRYPVECLRRPDFISSSRRRSSSSKATSMFSSMMSAAKGVKKGVLEDSYLYVGGEIILELSTPKFGTLSTVDVALPITTLSKLKFRRGESVSFAFKGNQKEPLIYLAKDSEDVVRRVKDTMGAKGVQGKHLKPSQVREVERAVELVTLIQVKEASLDASPPTLQLVEEIMDLYRRSIETFVGLGDERYKGVKEAMVAFLGREDVVRALDGGRIKQTTNATLSDDESDGEEDKAGGGGDKIKEAVKAVEEAVKNAPKEENPKTPEK